MGLTRCYKTEVFLHFISNEQWMNKWVNDLFDTVQRWQKRYDSKAAEAAITSVTNKNKQKNKQISAQTQN